MKKSVSQNARNLVAAILMVSFHIASFGQSYEKTWMPDDPSFTEAWIRDLCKEVKQNPQELILPIQNFKNMVEADPVLNKQIQKMFKESKKARKKTPLGTPQVKNFDQFLDLLNAIMLKEPEYLMCENDNTGALSPCGLLGFPINALLDWPMATESGYQVFSNHLVNQQFKVILNHWSKHLSSPASREVLIHNDLKSDPQIIAWLSDSGRAAVIRVACEGLPEAEKRACMKQKYEDIFKSNPKDTYYGYKSWDDFFTREFVDGQRPVAGKDDGSIIANACESTPYNFAENVQENDQFWLKGQPYSLQNMMAGNPLASKFHGGTIYQAFLSGLSFHRWNSPVKGKVVDAYVVDGSYYLQNPHEGFSNPHPDAEAPNNSQAFLTATATRAVIFIEADNPDIGLMCFMAIGMAEVSSCEITALKGARVEKGEQLGMFHFGGSTHCLIFRPEVELEFNIFEEGTNNANSSGRKLIGRNIPVNSAIARVKN